tara:strand:- start:1202 stop:2308 length:1107 start_codon:yes stop_codon:yes gene_type:complete
MNNLIIESIGRPIEEDFSKTSVAHARNSVILSKLIGADIVTCERDMHKAKGQTYDNIICCYASPYMKYKKLIQIVRDSPKAKLWWFVNDHDLEDNILLRNVMKEDPSRRSIAMICNNPRENYRGWILRKKLKEEDGTVYGLLDDVITEWHTININALMYDYEHPYKWEDKTEDSIYWGTMRKWRLEDLLEYQKTGMTLSATSRTQNKFIEKGVTECQFVDKLSWQKGHEDLIKYKFSLYIEDDHTHDHYAFLANRFYESLMYNVINIFDSKCAENMKKSGYDIPEEFVVNDSIEFMYLTQTLSSKEDFECALKLNEEHKQKARVENAESRLYLSNLFGLHSSGPLEDLASKLPHDGQTCFGPDCHLCK